MKGHDWIHVAEDRENSSEPLVSTKAREFHEYWVTVGFWRQLVTDRRTTNFLEQGPSWETWAPQLVKTVPTLYKTWRFISIFTKACDCTLSWARWIHSMAPIQFLWHPVYTLVFQVASFFHVFLLKFLYISLPSFACSPWMHGFSPRPVHVGYDRENEVGQVFLWIQIGLVLCLVVF